MCLRKCLSKVNSNISIAIDKGELINLTINSLLAFLLVKNETAQKSDTVCFSKCGCARLKAKLCAQNAFIRPRKLRKLHGGPLFTGSASGALSSKILSENHAAVHQAPNILAAQCFFVILSLE
jgi:hypothetical protein